MNRLFEIVYILLSKKIITAKELANRFGVSVRTIYRDIDTLSISGIPIYTTKGKNGGIQLLDGFVMDKAMLSSQEKNEIMFALQSIENLKKTPDDMLRTKLSQLFKTETIDWIRVDFSSWGNTKHEEKIFQEIKEAILNTKLIQFSYLNASGNKSIRIIEPMQICFKTRAWYLMGYCRNKKDMRLFKIHRMREVEMLDETFLRREMQENTKQYDISSVTITLEISQELAYRVYDEFEEEQIQINQKGDFLVTMTYPEDEWVYGYILSFGGNATVISPNYIREIIREKANRIVENYI